MSGTPPTTGESVQPGDELRDEIAHLHEAVRSQRAIGVAIGLVSATYGCSTDQAWRTLLRVSQDSNTKVRTVASVLVAVHDGTATPEDHDALKTFGPQLPAPGWGGGPSA